MAAYAKSPGGDAKLEAMLAGVPHWTIEIYNCLLNLYGKQDKKEKVLVYVDAPEGTRGRQVQVTITSKKIKVVILGKEALSGELCAFCCLTDQ